MIEPPAIHAQEVRSVSLEAIVWALGEKESGSNDKAKGGRFCFQRAAWAQSSSLPYRFCHDPKYSIHAAERYVMWIEQELWRHNYRVDPYFIALAWRAGVSHLSHGFTTHDQRGYAQLVENLYRDRIKVKQK